MCGVAVSHVRGVAPKAIARPQPCVRARLWNKDPCSRPPLTKRPVEAGTLSVALIQMSKLIIFFITKMPMTIHSAQPAKTSCPLCIVHKSSIYFGLVR